MSEPLGRRFRIEGLAGHHNHEVFSVRELADDPMHLFLPCKTVEKALTPKKS